jgi:predicted ester cyclase
MIRGNLNAEPIGWEFVRTYVEEFINRRNWQAISTLLAEDFVYHGPNGGTMTGRERYAKGSAAFLQAFPDWQAGVEDLVQQGSLVVDRVHITATHSALINDVAPTDERIDDDCAHLWRIEDGLIAEGWLFCNANMLRVMRLASGHA